MAINVKKTIDNIVDKYHTSVNTNLIKSKTDSKFYIDEDNAEELNNITNVLSNAVFKDTEYLNSAENDISASMSDILIDYCRNGINHTQLFELLSMVMQYNNQVNMSLNSAGTSTSETNIVSTYNNYHNIIHGISIVNNKIYIAADSYASKLRNNIMNDYCLLLKYNTEYINIKNDNTIDEEVKEKKLKNWRNLINNDIDNQLLIARSNLNECELEYINALTYWYVLYGSSYGIYPNNTYNKYEIIPYINTADNADDIEYGSDIKTYINKSNLHLGNNGTLGVKDILGISRNEPNTLKSISIDNNTNVVYQVGNTDGTVPKTTYLKYNNNIIYVKIPGNTSTNTSDMYIPVRSNQIREYTKFNTYFTNYNDLSNNEYKYYVLTNKYILTLKRNTEGKITPNASQITDDNLFIKDTAGNFIDLNTFSSKYENINIQNKTNYYIELECVESIGLENPFNYLKPVDSNNTEIKPNADLNNVINTFKSNVCEVIHGLNPVDNITDPIIINTSVYSKYANSWYSLYDVKDFEIIKKKAIKIDFTITGYDLTNANPNNESMIISDTSLSAIDSKKYPVVIECNNVVLADTEPDVGIKLLINNFISNNNIKVTDDGIENPTDFYINTNAVNSIQNIMSTNTLGTTVVLSFSILYKELNKLYRVAQLSTLQELLIAAYLTNNKATMTINNSRFISGLSSYEDNKILTSDEFNIIKDSYCNVYLSRAARDNDIIRLVYGKTIGFGTDSEDISRIDILLECYDSVRNYFYDVLYNKAFILDEAYKIFIFMYIIGFTIDRYFSTEIANLGDINRFTIDNCMDFLESYGLGDLANTIQKSIIPDKLAYSRAIVATYCDLVRYKGSKKVIDIITDMFNKAGSIFDIAISKYILYEEYDDKLLSLSEENDIVSLNNKSNIKFISINYGTSNSIQTIDSNLSYAEVYDNFIKDDEYWSSDDIKADDIKELHISPESTKYLGITLSSDICTYHILNQYVYSLVEYLQEKMQNDVPDNDVRTLFDNISFEIEGISLEASNNEQGNEISIIELFELLKVLVSLYNKLLDVRYSITDKINADLKETDTRKIYGINKNGTIDKLIEYLKNHEYSLYKSEDNDIIYTTFKLSDSTDSDDITITSGINEIFNNKLMKYNRDNNTYSLDTASFKYYDSYKHLDSSNNVASSVLLDSIVVDKLLPIKDIGNLTSSIKYSILNIADKEYYGNYGVPKLESVHADDSSIYTVDKILNDINPIIALNTKSDSTLTNIDIMSLFAYKNQAVSNGNMYTTEIVNSYSEQNMRNNMSLLYSTLLEGIVKFPNEYLNGYYNPSKTSGVNKINYTRDARILIDGIFDTFFTIDVSDTSERKSYIYDLNTESMVNTFVKNTTGINPALHDFTNIQASQVNKVNIKNAIDRAKSIITYALGNTGILSKDDAQNDIINIVLKADEITDTVINEVLNKIFLVTDMFSAYLESYSYINAKYTLSESTESTSAFMISLIKLFISYTCNIYKSETSNMYNNKFEIFKTSYSFRDSLEVELADTMYYDESLLYKVAPNN